MVSPFTPRFWVQESYVLHIANWDHWSTATCKISDMDRGRYWTVCIIICIERGRKTITINTHVHSHDYTPSVIFTFTMETFLLLSLRTVTRIYERERCDYVCCKDDADKRHSAASILRYSFNVIWIPSVCRTNALQILLIYVTVLYLFSR